MRASKKRILKVIGAGVGGNILEWLDFSIYGFFSPVLAKLFFPHQHYTISLLLTFLVFGIGFLIRPLGAVLFGYIGDRYGRKNALLYSVVLISLPTVLMGTLPVYEQIGLAAPLLLATLRLLQGLSVGGEFTSSMLYLVENAPKDRRGFLGCWVFFGAGIGMSLGSTLCACLTNSLTTAELEAWGWRIPFLSGFITMIFAFYLRWSCKETSEYLALQKAGLISLKPITESMQTLKTNMGLVIGLSALSAISGYILYVYLPTYLHQAAHMPLPEALFINSFSLWLFTLLVPFSGLASDRLGRQKALLIGAVGLACTAIPAFTILSQAKFTPCLIAVSTLTLFQVLFQGSFPAAVTELFPTRLRASAVGMGYNFALSCFAGTCPFICTLLIQETGSVLSPAYYLITAACVSGVIATYIGQPSRTSWTNTTTQISC